MAQTTGAVSGANFAIEASTNGSSWTDISGSSNSISEISQNRMVGEAYTADGDTAVITSGKREPVDVQARILYTEETAEAFETIRAWHEAGDRIYVRYAPRGKNVAAGVFVWNVVDMPISNFVYPAVDAASAGPIMCSFTVRAPKVDKTTAATSTGLGS